MASKSDRLSSDPLVAELRVWYHMPISLRSDLPADFGRWVDRSLCGTPPDREQVTYFHKYIADNLFGSGKTAQFNVLVDQAKPGEEWYPEFDEERWENGKRVGHRHVRFRVIPMVSELWIAKQEDRFSEEKPGLAILAVEVSISGVAKAETPEFAPHALDSAPFSALHLSDAMDALEWLRRIFPRWRKEDGRPGDSIAQVVFKDGRRLEAHPPAEDEARFRSTGEFRLFPWIECLLRPFYVDGTSAAHMSDERAFMSSAIALETPEGMDDRSALRAVPDSSLFRLAEADRAGDGGYNYNLDFLDTLRDRYFYKRHAPVSWPRKDGVPDHGNSTLHLMSQHHLCSIGTGWFAKTDMVKYMGRYYRYMQLLCVFEYFRLIQFSQRLTRLVETTGGEDKPFRDGVLMIRKEFLQHTHLHHFTNVSSQLQAKEMFDRIYAVSGLRELHEEVEDELASAADYAAMTEAADQAKRGEQLNNLVAIGVPAGLALALVGLDPVVGENAIDLPLIDRAGHAPSGDVAQILVVFLAVFLVWGIADWQLRGRGSLTKGRLAVGVVLAALVLLAVVWNGFMAGYLPLG